MAFSLLHSPLAKVSHLIKQGSLSITDLCEACLKRIQDTKHLNAFITITEDLAREQADSAGSRISKRQSLGPLDGIPVAFKDNWNTKHIRTTCASKMLSNYYSPYNATVVQKLFNEGSIMVGKTNMDEFAMGSATVDSCFGPTKNPWRSGIPYKLRKRSDSSVLDDASIQTCPIKDQDFFVAGGSSGGSAVAVATGACFGAIGSDTGGSTRNPAAFCGVVGLKPSYGLVSRNGLIPLCNSLDVPGIIARTVDDTAFLLNCIAGHDRMDSTTVAQENVHFTLPDNPTVNGLNIGIPKEYECPGMSQEVLDAWNTVTDSLEKAGAKVTRVSLPHTKYSIMCYSVLCCCEVASNFARYDGIRYGHRAATESSSEHHYAVTRREAFGEVVRERILAGNYFLLKDNYERYFLQAARVRRLICNDFHSVFKNGVDLLLTPVTLTEPIPYKEWIKVDNREHNAVDDFCTQPVNMAGLPAVSIPCKLSQQGLPISLQLIGQVFQEEKMLVAAKWVEQQTDFPLLDFS